MVVDILTKTLSLIFSSSHELLNTVRVMGYQISELKCKNQWNCVLGNPWSPLTVNYNRLVVSYPFVSYISELVGVGMIIEIRHVAYQ